MNERIKELLVKSDNGQFHDGKFYAHIGSRTIEDWEKFAELIVRECIAQCNKKDPRPDAYSDMAEFAESRKVRECISSIKEHFGVE